ncbi:MAG: Lipid A export ATP-binding/permease protein MsbA [Chloroflexi bacterium]|nr:Lipid A export ATP-binding/permease protein MsbA [Chloroflexota bacterium]
MVDPVEPRPTPQKYDIVFQDLSFSYGKTPQDVSRNCISVQNGILPNDLPNRPAGGSDLPALFEVSFKVEEGQSLAIVGPSGAGKSTLLNLLLRFWDFVEGEILLGGQLLRDYTQKDVREKMSVISQRSYFFNATLSENLRLANPGASQREIEEASAQAQIHNFISSFPLGYETLIGEQGTRLSGGKRQRLAIARAIFKNAPILLLDEPTTDLDTLTEKRVLDTLFALMKGRTALLITHRLVGLENVDEILVLGQGRILERGTHAELLSQKGLNWQMREIQNRVMRET